MKIGLDKVVANKKAEPIVSDEYLDAMLVRDAVAMEEYERYEDAVENLKTLRSLCQKGHTDLASAIAGFEVSEESLNQAITSAEDFASAAAKTGMIAADIGTLGLAGHIKQLVERCMETTRKLSRKFYQNLRRLKGRKIEDSDIVNTRCPSLRPFNSWIFRAQIVMKIHQIFNGMTPRSAFDDMKKMAELCNQLGWKPRGLFKNLGIHQQSLGTAFQERWAVSSDKAGKLGWNAAKFKQAVEVCDKLLNYRIDDLTVDISVLKQLNNLNRSGLTIKQMNKALTAVTYCAYHEIGKLVRCVNKFMVKIDADYREDDED